MKPYRYFADQYERNPDPDLELYAHYGHVLYAHKASEGRYHVDRCHWRRTRHAHELGLTVLHYHYCRPDQRSVPQEAVVFWDEARLTFQPGDYLALDFEQLALGMTPIEAAGYIANLAFELAQLSKHDPLVYGSTSFLTANVGRGLLVARRRWEAAYGPKPGWGVWRRPWWAWQASDGVYGPQPHRLAGIPAGDVSVLNQRTALVLNLRFSRRRRRVQHHKS
jgi:GH25 family lysozyme M1 (1,4-beta-N-acetylmuramidase)